MNRRLVGSNDVLAMIERLGPLAECVRDDWQSLQPLYAGLDPERDVRLRMLAELHDANRSLMLCLQFTRDQLLSDQWDDSGNARQSREDRLKDVSAFFHFSQAGYLHALFVVVESSLRLILKAMDPLACEGGRSDFRHIYGVLISSKLAAPPADAIVLLDLLRLIKNAVHHNGIHQSRRGGDTDIDWKGTIYRFLDGRPVDFLSMELILEIADAIRVLLRQIAVDPAVRALTGVPGGPG